MYKSSAVAVMGDRGHNRHGPKRGGCCAPFAQGELGTRLTQCGLGRGLLPYQVASSSIQPFGHNRHGPKIGWGLYLFWGSWVPNFPSNTKSPGPKPRGLCPFCWGSGSPSNTKSPGPRPTSIPSGILIYPTIWPQRTWAENWGHAPLGEAESPSNTMWPGPRPACTTSFILIHPIVWPQYTNIADIQNRQTGRDRHDIQRSDSTGRTVLQTVAQN